MYTDPFAFDKLVFKQLIKLFYLLTTTSTRLLKYRISCTTLYMGHTIKFSDFQCTYPAIWFPHF